MEKNQHPVSGDSSLEAAATNASSSGITASAAKPNTAEKQADQSSGHVARERLFAMAKRYRKEGQVREAMEMFWELAEVYSDSIQGKAAKELLLDMAAGYERDGSPRLARSIYERILDDED